MRVACARNRPQERLSLAPRTTLVFRQRFRYAGKSARCLFSAKFRACVYAHRQLRISCRSLVLLCCPPLTALPLPRAVMGIAASQPSCFAVRAPPGSFLHRDPTHARAKYTCSRDTRSWISLPLPSLHATDGLYSSPSQDPATFLQTPKNGPARGG